MMALITPGGGDEAHQPVEAGRDREVEALPLLWDEPGPELEIERQGSENTHKRKAATS